MRTIADQPVREALIGRLRALTPAAKPRWGILTAPEMLCHLADAGASVLGSGQRSAAPVSRPLYKWLALSAPIPWPRGLNTPPSVDPRAGGSRPGDFEQDRARVIAGLERIATATTLAPAHSRFGRMAVADWQRWAWRHVDHHLRQFGV